MKCILLSILLASSCFGSSEEQEFSWSRPEWHRAILKDQFEPAECYLNKSSISEKNNTRDIMINLLAKYMVDTNGIECDVWGYPLLLGFQEKWIELLKKYDIFIDRNDLIIESNKIRISLKS